MSYTQPPPLFASFLPDTPIGPVNAAWTEQGVVAVRIGDASLAYLDQLAHQLGRRPHSVHHSAPDTPLHQLEEYLHGERKQFSLSIDWGLATPFQRQVLEKQMAIPYGETRTYGQIALALGKPRAARAVGRAGATNPIPLIIPCHRVIGADGQLRGYGAPGGIETKRWLLAMEREATSVQS